MKSSLFLRSFLNIFNPEQGVEEQEFLEKLSIYLYDFIY